MLTKNNWLQTNIKKRVQERQLSLEVTLTPDIISSTDFNSAADKVLTELLDLSATEKFYLGFSGGADSDFVFYKLIEWGIPFEPIICFFGGNSIEYQYALHTCKKFGITPYIHTLSEKQFIQIFMQKVKPWGGDGLYSIPSMVLAEYAKSRDAKLLTGQDFITGSHDHCSMGFNVYDFYADIYDESIEIPFFLYNTDIVYHTIKRFNPNISVGEWKYELFEILDYRPKIEFHHLSRECWEVLGPYFSYAATHFNNEGIDVINKEKILRALENTGEKIVLNASHTY